MPDAELLGLDDDTWGRNRALTTLARQRHILQVQYTDRLVGELMRRMKASGLWDRAAVVITADHGVSFQPGQGRRDVTRQNIGEIGWVPLFVKSPGQQAGNESVEPVQLVDVLPTVADILQVELPWRVQGQSVLSPSRLPSPRTMLIAKGRRLDVDRVHGREQMLARSVGAFAPRRGDPWRIYRVGTHASLIGAPIAEFAQSRPEAGPTATLQDSGAWSDVALEASQLPTYVRAEVAGLRRTTTSVVVAVNGAVAAVVDVSKRSLGCTRWRH